MALLTILLKDGRNVPGEGDCRRACGLLRRGLLRRWLRGPRLKEKYRYRADPGPLKRTTEASCRHMAYLTRTLHYNGAFCTAKTE